MKRELSFIGVSMQESVFTFCMSGNPMDFILIVSLSFPALEIAGAVGRVLEGKGDALQGVSIAFPGAGGSAAGFGVAPLERRAIKPLHAQKPLSGAEYTAPESGFCTHISGSGTAQ